MNINEGKRKLQIKRVSSYNDRDMKRREYGAYRIPRLECVNAWVEICM